jgi:anthranilate phosphoribosyltransferase
MSTTATENKGKQKSLKEVLARLTQHHTLSREEAREVLTGIAKSEYNESQIAVFLAVYMMRSITVEELEGFRDALLELCIRIDLSDYDPIDLCGTGGDGKDTFNISTLASFVAAGAGIKVAKHGNYGVSSACGSSNVLEHLGVTFTTEKDILERNIEESGICFLHAPLFHPALKNVGPIRKALGMRTFFNMLGPMVNPTFPKKQMVGVFSLELARLYAYLYQQTDKNFVILHALDGYDEVSLTGDVKMFSNKTERILRPTDLGLTANLDPAAIAGGTSVEASAKIFVDVLSGAGTQAQNQVVCANAAMAVYCVFPELGLDDAFMIAKESLDSGRALKSFKSLIAQ